MAIAAASGQTCWDTTQQIGITTACTLHTAGGIGRNVSAVLEIFKAISVPAKVAVGLAGTKFTAGLLIPLNLVEFFERIANLLPLNDGEVFFDNFMGMIGEGAELIDGAANLAEGAAAVLNVAIDSVAWAGPAGLIASCMSGVFFYIHGKGISETQRMLNKLEKARNLDKIDLDVIELKFVDDDDHKYGLEQYCGISINDLSAQITVIKNNADATENTKALYEALKTKIKHQQASAALGIVITAVGIIASAILFASAAAPCAIAGCVLLIGLYAFSLAKMGTKMEGERQYRLVVPMAVTEA